MAHTEEDTPPLLERVRRARTLSAKLYRAAPEETESDAFELRCLLEGIVRAVEEATRTAMQALTVARADRAELLVCVDKLIEVSTLRRTEVERQDELVADVADSLRKLAGGA